MSSLIEYFQTSQSTYSALDRYLEFASSDREQPWYIGGTYGKLRLYDLANHAFNPLTPRSDALIAFRKVYDSVRLWPGVQRSGGGSLALADNVFPVLLEHGSDFLCDSNINLTNLKLPSSQANDIKAFLPTLKFIKQNESYPWMAVSKVLHFVNPGLFPIWDWGIVWYKVMWREPGVRNGAFRKEYSAFCARMKKVDRDFEPQENGARFILNYTLWAAEYIQQADIEFMRWFSDWMSHHFSDDLAKYNLSQRIHTFYATAFEFVAIGAAHLELADGIS